MVRFRHHDGMGNERSGAKGSRTALAVLAVVLLPVFVLAEPARAEVTFDWIEIGDPGNASDASGYGAVADVYWISRYETTNAQYAEFLNAVAASDPNGLYNIEMDTHTHGGILQSGVDGAYTYSVKPGVDDEPVNFVSFEDAMRFANWLHNGQPVGAQDASTTEDGAYQITASGLANNDITREPLARVFVTSEGEWYKAAYYDELGAVYYDYPAGSDTASSCSAPGATPNTGNCLFMAPGGGPADVGGYTASASPAGTFDQGGNLWEWNEGIVAPSTRGSRGGTFNGDAVPFAASFRGSSAPTTEAVSRGFRVAAVLDCETIPGNELSPCGFEDAGELAAWSSAGGFLAHAPGLGENGGGAVLASGQNFGSSWVMRLASACHPVLPGEEFAFGYSVKLASGTAPTCRGGWQQWSDLACTAPSGGNDGLVPMTPDAIYKLAGENHVVGMGTGTTAIQFRATCRGDAPFDVLVDNAFAVKLPTKLRSARVDPLVIRKGVDTFTLTVDVPDPDVTQVTIDTGGFLDVGGLPVTEIVLFDDGVGADAVAGDLVFSADGIDLQSMPLLLGGQVLRSRDVEFLFSDLSTESYTQDLGLTLRYIDPSIPIPTTTDYAPDVRATSHVASIELDVELYHGEFPSFVTSRLVLTERYLEIFPDDRDWVMAVDAYNTTDLVASMSILRNDVQGIGLGIFDNSTNFGSASVLRGVPKLNRLTAIDFSVVNHELAHQFAADFDPALDLADGTGHWDVIARPETSLGTVYSDIDFVSGNTYHAYQFGGTPLPETYNDLELYAMGLVDISEVASPVETLVNPVFQSLGGQFCDGRGCSPFTWEYQADSLRSVTTAEIVATEGARVPDSTSSPKAFRSGMVVGYERLLSDVELAFFDYAMREYEKPTSTLGTTFEEATGGRATIETSLVPEPGLLGSLVSGLALLRMLGRRQRADAL